MSISQSIIISVPLLLLLSALVASASPSDGYSSSYIPSNQSQPKQEQEKLLSTNVGIQGIIYCKTGSKLTPLEGAVARVTCLVDDEHGYERAPFSILSDATDDKGYFFAVLSPDEVQKTWRVKECRAFLEVSPDQTCNVPTDINMGTTGALLDSYRLLTQKKMKLFSVPPFCFSPESEFKSVSDPLY